MTGPRPTLPDLPRGTVAVGWATVELDRAAVELAGLLDPGTAFVVAASSAALGTACRVGRIAADGLRIVLLEPETEGRLASFLARHGEGWAAIWLPATDADGRDRRVRPVPRDPRDRPRATDVAHDEPTRPGPLGPERLVPGSAAGGPYRLLVSAAGTGRYHRAMTETALNVRRAESADGEAIATLFTDEGYPAGPSDIVERLTRFASDHSRVVVAEHEGTLLGFVAVHALPRFEHDDRIIRVLALVVDAGARERGVGHALLAEAERIGSELGAAFIEITAGHHRPEARRLYESLGYDAGVAAYLRKKL